ncbi:MAG TPA: hypothetical protein VGI99_05900, partial [Gemmataceae bacterium]
MSDPLPFETELKQVQPALRLVPERRLRKLLHYLRDHGRAIPLNPALPLWISRADVEAADVLPSAVLEGSDDPLLFVTVPNDRLMHALPRGDQLREYWRLLFRGAALAAVDARIASGALSPALCEERLAQFGAAAAREVRYVLEAEHRVDSGGDAVAVYRAFAATYLDLHAFQPEAYADFFPTLPDDAEVLDLLRHDVDANNLLAQSRPDGAAAAAREHEFIPAPAAPLPSALDSTAIAEAEAKRNFVRAAILLTRTALGSADSASRLIHSNVRHLIDKLVNHLGAVLGWDEAVQMEWQRATMPLIEPAADGNWPRAARCLYELQKIPGEFSRQIFAVDLVEPIRTLGRRPIKRPLPHARDVMLLLKFRTAQK